MFKFSVIVVILCQKIVGFSSAIPTDASSYLRYNLVSTNAPTNFPKNGTVLSINYNFYADNQVFHSNAPPANTRFEIDSDYVITHGIGAHKMHREGATWKEAWKICNSEKAHLAVIRSEAEEKVALGTFKDEAGAAWIGVHDQFTDGQWVSVFDEPLNHTGWSRWTDKWKFNPGSQHCAVLLFDGGMADLDCTIAIPFICKIDI